MHIRIEETEDDLRRFSVTLSDKEAGVLFAKVDRDPASPPIHDTFVHISAREIIIEVMISQVFWGRLHDVLGS